MPLHETDLNRNRHGFNALNHAIDLGYSQATTSPANFAAVKAGISALSVHETQSNIIRQVNKNLDVAFAIGTLTDANCAVGTSANNAAMQALFTSQDANLAAGARGTFAFQG